MGRDVRIESDHHHHLCNECNTPVCCDTTSKAGTFESQVGGFAQILFIVATLGVGAMLIPKSEEDETHNTDHDGKCS